MGEQWSMHIHTVAIWFNFGGTAIVAIGIVAALSQASRWVARLALAAGKAGKWISRHVFGKKTETPRPDDARLRISSVWAQGTPSLRLDEVDPESDLEQRVSELEVQLREELKERREVDTALAQESLASIDSLRRDLSGLDDQIGQTKIEVLSRLDEQARNGLGVAAFGATILFAGALLEVISSAR